MNEVAQDATPTQNTRVEYFHRRVLRRLYDSGGSNQGAIGTKKRYKMSLNLTPATHDKLGETVVLGKGSYGAPTIELGVRLLLCLVGQVDTKQVADELMDAVVDKESMLSNLNDLTTHLENKFTAE